jgi:hypothetical protein
MALFSRPLANSREGVCCYNTSDVSKQSWLYNWYIWGCDALPQASSACVLSAMQYLDTTWGPRLNSVNVIYIRKDLQVVTDNRCKNDRYVLQTVPQILRPIHAGRHKMEPREHPTLELLSRCPGKLILVVVNYDAILGQSPNWSRRFRIQISVRIFIEHVLSEKLTVPQLVTKFLVFYVIRMFITVLKTARTRLIQPKPSNPISQTSILILSSHLRLPLPSRLPKRVASNWREPWLFFLIFLV